MGQRPRSLREIIPKSASNCPGGKFPTQVAIHQRCRAHLRLLIDDTGQVRVLWNITGEMMIDVKHLSARI